MILNLFESFIKLLGINLCITYSFIKIMNYQPINPLTPILLIVVTIFSSIINIIFKEFINSIFVYITIYLLYNLLLSILTKNKFAFSLIATIISVSITYILCTITAAFTSIIETLLQISNNSIFIIFVHFIDFILIYRIFKLKRFKNGFQFIRSKQKNDYLDFFVLIISILIIYLYIFMGNYNNLNRHYLFYYFILLSIIMFVAIQKSFVLYQKHKLLEKTLKEYEIEIKEKDEKIEQLLTEENKLVKANHEFYHRQEALKHRLMNLKEYNSGNFNEEYEELIDRIDSLSEEYENQIEISKLSHKLPKSDIKEIDDMFSYLQAECIKNNIEFVLKIEGNIHSLINNIIPKNKLETLIGDLVRNSIIAISYSDKEYRSIMVILGIKDNYYEFCVYDSGIEFQIDTLLKLGLEKATTHKDNGGTGIGYITTFETLESCNASLIINELDPSKNNYTKSITVRFDNKYNYIVNSYRFSELKNISKIRDNITVNPY